MMFITRFFSLLILFLFSLGLYAQPDVSELRAVDTIYKDYIKTIEFYNNSEELSMPIVNREQGSMHVGFDDHYGQYIDYYYSVVHCDRNWNFTENVEFADFLNGQQEIQVESFGSAISTIKNYTHYDFDFPNEDLSFNWSGNYLLVVYDADYTVAFTRRFYVVDEIVTFINPAYTRPNGVGEFYSHQSFNFQLGIGQLDPINPLNEIFVT